MENEKLIELIKKEIEKYLSTSNNSIFILGEDPVLETEIKKYFSISKTANKIVVFSLSIPELVALSNGNYINEKTEILIKGLLEKKEIFIIYEGIEWREFNYKNLTLADLYLNYEKKLISFGAILVKKIEILDYLNEKKIYLNKKVITPREFKEFKNIKNCCFVIPKNSFITESTKEFLEKNYIKIIKE